MWVSEQLLGVLPSLAFRANSNACGHLGSAAGSPSTMPTASPFGRGTTGHRLRGPHMEIIVEKRMGKLKFPHRDTDWEISIVRNAL